MWRRFTERGRPNRARTPEACTPLFPNARVIRSRLSDCAYEASAHTALAVHMADATGRALLVEGGSGVGKTQLGTALATAANARLIRLQCYDGIGQDEALYAWNHCKQILRLQNSVTTSAPDVFGAEFLLDRPLLAALRGDEPTVLLIDEIDKAHLEFDALLLEVLSDFAITITEYGTVAATRRPLVIITSGGARELSDALRRRCHFLHLPVPSKSMTRRILDRRVPEARRLPGSFVEHVADFVDALRDNGLSCGVSGLVDAVAAVCYIDRDDREQLREALCCTLVHKEVELPTFGALFDLWFPARGSTDRQVPDAGTLEHVADSLADPDAGSVDMNALAAELVSEFGEYRSLDGESYSALQVVRALNPEAMADRVALQLGMTMPNSPFNSAVAERTARQRVAELRQAVVGETNRLVAQRRSRERVAEYAVPRTTPVDLDRAVDGSELAAVRRAVVELGRILAVRQASQRRRARAGEIDLRRTLRKSMSTGGVPITLLRRRPRVSKPELVVLCDMSSSVSEFSYFTLILVDALRAAFSRVRIFAFVDTIDEVTYLFKAGADLNAAVARLNVEADIGIGQRSDYGRSLAGFEAEYPDAVTSKTSLLVIGDARSNNFDPRADVVGRLVATAKQAHWLNPERETQWGTGDSAATEYQREIVMHECRNATQLADVVGGLIEI